MTLALRTHALHPERQVVDILDDDGERIGTIFPGDDGIHVISRNIAETKVGELYPQVTIRLSNVRPVG